MSSLPNATIALETDEERFIREIEAATDLESLKAPKEPKDMSFALRENYLKQMHRVMRLRISSMRTPEDVMETHRYFDSQGTYSREIQEELGDKARKIFAEWRPSSYAFRGRGSRM